MGYTHDVACPNPTAVCTNGVLAVQKAVGNETIDELGGAATGVSGGSVDLQWFSTAGSASNSVKLTNTVVVAVDLSTKDDGSLLENDSFGCVQITWRAGHHRGVMGHLEKCRALSVERRGAFTAPS